MKRIRSTAQERVAWLRRTPLFAELPDPDAERLAEVVSRRAYGPGEVLFRNGEEADGFHVVTHGKIKVYRIGADGREQVLHLMGPGALVGEVPVFQGRCYPATAEAADEVQALYVPAREFLDLGRRCPEILLEMLAVLSLRLRRFVSLIDDLALKEVSARLARHILEASIAQGADTVQLDTTKAVLASRLGTIAETLSRTLGKMQKRAIIDVAGPTIRILDRPALTALADGMKL